MQHATCNTQHATCNPQRAARNPQHATCNIQPAMCNIQRAACLVQHTTGRASIPPGSRATAHRAKAKAKARRLLRDSDRHCGCRGIEPQQRSSQLGDFLGTRRRQPADDRAAQLCEHVTCVAAWCAVAACDSAACNMVALCCNMVAVSLVLSGDMVYWQPADRARRSVARVS